MTNLPTIIEEIAQQWDGCMYDSGLCGNIDIGAAIREAAHKRLMLAAMSSKPEQAQEAVAMWDRFIAHLNVVQPLGKDKQHISFLGSIDSYKRLFLEAQAVDADGLTEADTSATASVAGLSAAAPAVDGQVAQRQEVQPKDGRG
jgi:hypothetical protein